ncbi:MAG TPA: tRNA preQ1(34) S-adenosylmethionine ribosyltransferase-isomerase QueA [Candidatus Polarisedimenticolia bacterium]|nr:tRNA preQ1(34) S-adenosylmethionine ribosyltransferase-isomerase QueA [Candidatus Polarisedimenticolia bacterium]
MLVSDFDFYLPEELIAQEALADRSSSRLLHLSRSTGRFEDRRFIEFPNLLRPGDLLVLNSSRVFPARLYGHRAGLHAQPVSSRNPSSRDFLHGRVEVMLTRQVGPLEWQALVRPGRKIGVGERIFFSATDSARLPAGHTSAASASAPDHPVSPLLAQAAELTAKVIGRGEFGERTLRFDPVPDFFAIVEQLGHVPLPPYIAREDRPEDRERYQTVYARAETTGSVAAPTAGLHFTPQILTDIRERGIEVADLTLHVGLGTFQPVHVENVEEHKLHRESFSISKAAAAQINRALSEKRRVVAVGTTTVRTLEFAASQNALSSAGTATVSAGAGEADIFIYPGFEFRVVSALLTNFHLPKSTLLMLVCAFAGRENVLKAYAHAVEEKYRFFSYGDCMFVQ